MSPHYLPSVDALREHIQTHFNDHRFYFRGEAIDWGTTHSTLDRLQASKMIPHAQWPAFDERLENVCVVLDAVLNSRPFHADPQSALKYKGPASLLNAASQLSPECLIYATLQHYELPSPFIDLTESLEFALFFASYPPKEKEKGSEPDTAVIFVADSQNPNIRRRLAQMPQIPKYAKSRYMRQKAQGLCLKLGTGVRDVNYVKGEDFRSIPGVTRLDFEWPGHLREAYHQEHRERLLSAYGDDLAWQVYGACEQGLDTAANRVHAVFGDARYRLARYSHMKEVE